MKKAAAVLFVILLIPIMVSGAAVLKNENPSKTENLGYGVTYEYWDTSTESGEIKMHSLSFNPSEKKAELKLGLSNRSVTGLQPLLGMSQDADSIYEGGVIGGINGGFFSMDISEGLGIPFDFMVQDGELYTSPPVPYKGEPNPPNGCDPYCIAMYDDNTAFVDYAPHMDITFYTEDNSYTVNHINRMRMDGSYSDYCPDALVLYTDKFGASTMTDSTGGQEVVIRVKKGKVRGGDVLEGTVERLAEPGKGNTGIEDGCVVLSGCNFYKDMLRGLKPGQTVYFSFEYAQERWNNVKFAMGGVQMLIIDGWINSGLSGSSDTGGYSSLSPMTAVGVKKDGMVIMLTVDGRQPGYSKGITVYQLAQLMLEQGCYNAIHLDGGGSTTMVINDGGLKVANSPSDGAQRSLANGILLVPYDGEPDIVKDSFNTLPDTPSADNSDTGSQSGPSAGQSGPAGNPESSGENAGTQSPPDSAEPTGPQTDDGTEVTDSAENKESAAEAEESDGTEVSENGGVSAAIIITAVSVTAAAALAAGAILLYRFKRRKKEQ